MISFPFEGEKSFFLPVAPFFFSLLDERIQAPYSQKVTHSHKPIIFDVKLFFPPLSSVNSWSNVPFPPRFKVKINDLFSVSLVFSLALAPVIVIPRALDDFPFFAPLMDTLPLLFLAVGR